MNASRILDTKEKEFQVGVQCVEQDARGVRIESEDGLLDKVGVKEAEGVEISRGWVDGVAVDFATDIPSWSDEGTRCDLINAVGAFRATGAEETVWHTGVLEESTGSDHVQLTIVLSTVDEEVYWECRLCVCGEIPGRDEGEGWIRRD